MKQVSLCLISLFLTSQAMAFCPFSDKLFSVLKEDSAITLYKNCAEQMNDDASQARLAAIYDAGTTMTGKDVEKALYYYQLSADNGNAASQARLAQLYMELDKDRNGRSALHSYLNSIAPAREMPKGLFEQKTQYEGEKFDGALVHPYVLLMLANEKTGNKWYYPTDVKQAPAYAVQLFKNYKIDDEKKKQFMRQATAWKKRKLLEAAGQVLSGEEYQNFVAVMYPAKGQADTFRRNRALENLQEKIKQKKQQDQSAKAFY